MNLKCSPKDFRVRAGARVRLGEWATRIHPLYKSKKHYGGLLAEYREEISELQSVMYAHDRYALLLIFQGMDTAGKDGAIKHVMSGVNPQGCQVFSFKQPSIEELEHDFLWRSNQRLPERGRIGIFNRSYYEEVLVARVCPAVLRNQRLPAEFVHPKRIWKERYRDIVNMEDYLHRNGTRTIKFFLNVSKEEQRHRFLARIDDPEKNWKMSLGDIQVREQWDAFRTAYAECLGATSTGNSPWYVIPADDKWNARLLISQIILETMRTLRMDFPSPSKEHRKELERVRRLLKEEGK